MSEKENWTFIHFLQYWQFVKNPNDSAYFEVITREDVQLYRRKLKWKLWLKFLATMLTWDDRWLIDSKMTCNFAKVNVFLPLYLKIKLPFVLFITCSIYRKSQNFSLSWKLIHPIRIAHAQCLGNLSYALINMLPIGWSISYTLINRLLIGESLSFALMHPLPFGSLSYALLNPLLIGSLNYAIINSLPIGHAPCLEIWQ